MARETIDQSIARVQDGESAFSVASAMLEQIPAQFFMVVKVIGEKPGWEAVRIDGPRPTNADLNRLPMQRQGRYWITQAETRVAAIKKAKTEDDAAMAKTSYGVWPN